MAAKKKIVRKKKGSKQPAFPIPTAETLPFSDLSRRDIDGMMKSLGEIVVDIDAESYRRDIEAEMLSEADIEKAVSESISIIEKEQRNTKKPKLSWQQLDEMKEDLELKVHRNLTSMAVDGEAVRYNLEQCAFSTSVVGKNMHLVSGGRIIGTIPDVYDANSRGLTVTAQYVSLMMQLIGIIVGICGCRPPKPSPSKIATVINKWAKNNRFVAALQKLIQGLAQKINQYEKAKKIWSWIKDLWDIGNCIKDLVEAYLHRMKWYHFVKAVAEIIATLVAAIASGTVALIAKIVIVLCDMYEFAMKIYEMARTRAVAMQMA